MEGAQGAPRLELSVESALLHPNGKKVTAVNTFVIVYDAQMKRFVVQGEGVRWFELDNITKENMPRLFPPENFGAAQHSWYAAWLGV